MPMGPGKYDKEAEAIKEYLNADGVLLVVINGSKGQGFSAVSTIEVLAHLPQMLRHVANEIEACGGKG